MTIRSIPGHYKGIAFRSQLEIGWAKWLDQHRIEWAYEEEGFDLDGLWYLPDFWLPGIQTFIEVKGALDDPSIDKLERFTRYAANRNVTVVLGESPAGLAARIVTLSNSGRLIGTSRVACVKCDKCQCWFWSDPDTDLRCRACGACEVEAAHIAATHPNAGRHSMMGDVCQDCGAIEGVLVRGGRW